jgi:hypothetical protein
MNRRRSFVHLATDWRVLGLFAVFAVPALLRGLLVPVVDGVGVVVLVVLSVPELLLEAMIWNGALDHWVRLAGEWALPSYTGGYGAVKYVAIYLFSVGSVAVGDWATRRLHDEATGTRMASAVAGGFLLVGVFMVLEPFVLEPPNPPSMACGPGWACDGNPWSFLVEWTVGLLATVAGIIVLLSMKRFRGWVVSRGILGLFALQLALFAVSFVEMTASGSSFVVWAVMSREAVLVNEAIELLLPAGLETEDWWLGLLAMPVVYYATAVVVAASGRVLSRFGRRRLG